MKHDRYIAPDLHALFNKNILEILRITGLRQMDLAEMCGWSRQTMSTIFNQDKTFDYQYAAIMFIIRIYILTNPDKLDPDIIAYSYKLYDQIEKLFYLKRS